MYPGRTPSVALTRAARLRSIECAKVAQYGRGISWKSIAKCRFGQAALWLHNKAVDKELEKFGVNMVAQYAVLGPFDFVNVIEAPDNMTVARISAELAARGTVRIQTLPAVPINEFIAKFK